MNFCDYIVFADESGDHSLKSVDPDFPVFALTFCVISKADYTTRIVPALQDFKFRYWGHDTAILHEHEIRKSKGDFAFLRSSAEIRESFQTELSEIMRNAPFHIIASVIDKNALLRRYPDPWSPYRLALHFCLERLLIFLRGADQEGKTAHVVFECRGAAEDQELELEFRRIINGERNWGWVRRRFADLNFEPVFSKKSENSIGLQLADLTARPIAINTLRPQQPNRAFDIIAPKIQNRKNFP